MATYLLTWNPNRWEWTELESDVALLDEMDSIQVRWSCGRSKRIEPGDRIFMIRLGKEPRGIFASGWALTSVFEDEHWDPSIDHPAQFVEVDLDVLLNPEKDSILPMQDLKTGMLNQMHWTTQTSGITIPNEVAIELEAVWEQFISPIETHNQQGTRSRFVEGASRQITTNRYERNSQARSDCIAHYGPTCVVCGFNFGEVYGEAGRGLIHVHHLVPLAEIGEQYQIDPIRDLRPVCPNCHAMIHSRRNPCYTIDEIRAMLDAAD